MLINLLGLKDLRQTQEVTLFATICTFKWGQILKNAVSSNLSVSVTKVQF